MSQSIVLFALLALEGNGDTRPGSERPASLHGRDAAVIYGRKGRIKKQMVGGGDAVDLGEGDCARFSPDGKRIAIFQDGRIFVANADGSGRKPVLEGADRGEDGCAVEFHASGKHIIYVKRGQGLWIVSLADGKTAAMDLPGPYTGEPTMSADGKRMTARWGHDLYAIDVVARTHRKFARGCAPSVSADGQWLINNVGSHRQIKVRRWGEGDHGEFAVESRGAEPDGRWDDFHFSNHPDLLVVGGEGKAEQVYVVSVSERRVWRVTGEGKVRFPDLFVAKASGTVKAAAAPPPSPARPGREGGDASDSERAALEGLAREISGSVVYGRKGHIWKVVLGRFTAEDLGEGELARWSPDGKKLAVYLDGAVHVMAADGSGRRKLSGEVDLVDDIPMTFSADGKDVVFTRRGSGLWAARVADGQVRRLTLPDEYTGEIRFAADGKRMTSRVGQDLYAVDVAAGTQRKFARGCSPGVSPDGRRLMNNIGGHKHLVIQGWDGDELLRLDTEKMGPDRRWNNHAWSNHSDYITAQGEKGPGEAYVVKVSENRAVRVTWHGGTRYPDLFVARGEIARRK